MYCKIVSKFSSFVGHQFTHLFLSVFTELWVCKCFFYIYVVFLIVGLQQICFFSSQNQIVYINNDESFADWTNSLIPESDKRDLYIGVVGKDLYWLESSAAPLVESVYKLEGKIDILFRNDDKCQFYIILRVQTSMSLREHCPFLFFHRLSLFSGCDSSLSRPHFYININQQRKVLKTVIALQI